MATHHTLPHAHLSPARLYSLFYLEDSTLLQAVRRPPPRAEGAGTGAPHAPPLPAGVAAEHDVAAE
eukprot:CAMPEP_0196696346 /NCGR_PEP_ID=MMETSP1090-20130531/39136_1 /TAXON_ID=37098 /ORGANISM="Isochrysis sp, Strain CCMP1244" /LENGTH=65 /DNA_ID=CAMNT_0042035939 /DNA_START=54 /DNA_END=249 /DNA_ORIENTATION=+